MIKHCQLNGLLEWEWVRVLWVGGGCQITVNKWVVLWLLCINDGLSEVQAATSWTADYMGIQTGTDWYTGQGTISGMIFPSMEFAFCSHPNCNEVIAMKFCTWQWHVQNFVAFKFCSHPSCNEVTAMKFLHMPRQLCCRGMCKIL